MFKKSMIAVLILLCCMAISSVCLSADSNVLKITANEFTYANLYKSIDIPSNAENITLEYYAKVIAGNWYSCGPAVHFWWDSGNGVAIKVNAVVDDKLDLRFFKPSNRGMVLDGYTPDNLPVTLKVKAWYGYKIQLDSEKVRFYIREIEGDWVELELAAVNRAYTISSPPDRLIVGTGLPGGDDYFRNSDARKDDGKRRIRNVYFDNVIVTVDGKVVFTETFERSIGELETDWDFAADPINAEPVFEVTSEPGTRPLPTIIEFSM